MLTAKEDVMTRVYDLAAQSKQVRAIHTGSVENYDANLANRIDEHFDAIDGLWDQIIQFADKLEDKEID